MWLGHTIFQAGARYHNQTPTGMWSAQLRRPILNMRSMHKAAEHQEHRRDDGRCDVTPNHMSRQNGSDFSPLSVSALAGAWNT